MGRSSKTKEDSICWFGSREIFHKIRKTMPPAYFKRFPLYFEQYGCIHCGRKDVPHCANGLCSACSTLIRLRFERIGKRLAQEDQPIPPERATLYLRKVTSARQLLEDLIRDPALKKFASKKASPVVAYLGKKSRPRVFRGDFDSGKLSWIRTRSAL